MTEPSNDSIPLPQAVSEFLDWQAFDKGRSPNTVRAYQQDLSKFIICCAAHDLTTLAEVDRVLMRSYQSQLARGTTTGTVPSAATRHRRLVALRSLGEHIRRCPVLQPSCDLLGLVRGLVRHIGGHPCWSDFSAIDFN